MLINNRTRDSCPPKRITTVVWQKYRSTYPVWRLEVIPTAGRWSLLSSVSAWGSPTSSLSRSTTKRVTKTPCLNQYGQNWLVQDTMEISWWRASTQRSVINKYAPKKRAGGGIAGWHRYQSRTMHINNCANNYQINGASEDRISILGMSICYARWTWNRWGRFSKRQGRWKSCGYSMPLPSGEFAKTYKHRVGGSC